MHEKVREVLNEPRHVQSRVGGATEVVREVLCRDHRRKKRNLLIILWTCSSERGKEQRQVAPLDMSVLPGVRLVFDQMKKNTHIF